MKVARFLVNLTDYLDTGLFLDHRNTHKSAGVVPGKDVLNLFSYGKCVCAMYAKSVTTVDMSNTYLNGQKKRSTE